MNALARLTKDKTALREGLKIVRNVVAANPHPSGFTTAELFKLAVKEAPPPDFKYEVLPPHKATYGKSGNQRKPEPRPPRPDHPIRSMTFLKNAVLPILEGNKELQIVRTTRILFNPAPPHSANQSGKRKNKRELASNAASAAAPAPVTVWLWKPVDQSTLPRPLPPKPTRKVFGAEVGVGEDWSHLSKRRRRARAGKVRRDVATMKAVIVLKKQRSAAALEKEAREAIAELHRRRDITRKMLAANRARRLAARLRHGHTKRPPGTTTARPIMTSAANIL